MRLKMLMLLGAFIFSMNALVAQDENGGEDHPVISRYPDSKIKYYYQQQYAELDFPQAVKEAKPDEILAAKGKHTSILYEAPLGVSTLEIFRNYKQAIIKANAEILFSCKGKYAPDGCDDYNEYYSLTFFDANYYQKRYNNTDQYILMNGSDDQAFLLAVFEDAAKKIYVEVGIDGDAFSDRAGIQVEILEEEKMKNGLITAETFEDEINKNGKIALYGILFETGKSELKNKSKHELSLVKNYLDENPEVELYIVGHTDDTGNLDMNVNLSNDRANAVIKYLEAQGIESSRIMAQGVGPFVPVSTNETDEGRRLNRRVEIVKRLK